MRCFGNAIVFLAACGFGCLASIASADDKPAEDKPGNKQTVLVVVGAAGEKDFGEQFGEWAGRWQAAAESANAEFAAIGLDNAGEKSDREQLQQRLLSLSGKSAEPVWLVLIGHGTFDGKTAKFNLRGPDFTPAELASWLKPIERPLAILDCTSSSGPFLAELSAPGRVVVTATRSGFEFNFARLGDHLSTAIADPAADLDKDEQISLLEAFLRAAAGVQEFYASEARLATEHALIDDTGDKQGTPADWFQGLRATKTAKDGAELDGQRAAQFVLMRSAREQQLPPEARARRDELERELAALRKQKDFLAEEEYLGQIEPLLIELARIYESAEKPVAGK